MDSSKGRTRREMDVQNRIVGAIKERGEIAVGEGRFGEVVLTTEDGHRYRIPVEEMQDETSVTRRKKEE